MDPFFTFSLAPPTVTESPPKLAFPAGRESDSVFLEGAAMESRAEAGWIEILAEPFLEIRKLEPMPARFAAQHPGQPAPSEEEERRRQRAFYDLLGPERPGVPCRYSGCSRGAIAYSVMCRMHHFQMVEGKPCPFDGESVE